MNGKIHREMAITGKLVRPENRKVQSVTLMWTTHLSLVWFDLETCNSLALRTTRNTSKAKLQLAKEASVISPYVYWAVHHLDSWIKTDQLDVIRFIISLFTAQHVSNVSTSIFTSLRLIVDLFHVLYCSGSICVGVTVWFGWGGVVSLCRLRH